MARNDESVRATLQERILPTEWAMLAMHHRRLALFIVGAGVSLLDVAVAVVEDRVVEVEGWLRSGQLARPTDEQVMTWSVSTAAIFQSVIAQPYVLAQLDATPTPLRVRTSEV